MYSPRVYSKLDLRFSKKSIREFKIDMGHFRGYERVVAN